MKDMRPMGRLWHLYKMGGITPAITSVFDAQNAQQMAFIRSIIKEQKKNSLYDIPLNTLELAVFDLETTGFSPYNGDEIISFGAVAVTGEEVDDKSTFYSLVNPKRKIPETVVELTGITDEMVQVAPDLITGLSAFLEFVGQKVLVAHASGHDKHFLNSALWKTSKINFSHRLLDTMMIGKWLYPKEGAYDLDTMLNKHDIPITLRHHALEDALMTAELWKRMLEVVRSKDVGTLGDLYEKLSHQT